MPELMWRAYQEVKLAECDAFEANDEEFELKAHFDVFDCWTSMRSPWSWTRAAACGRVGDHQGEPPRKAESMSVIQTI